MTPKKTYLGTPRIGWLGQGWQRQRFVVIFPNIVGQSRIIWVVVRPVICTSEKGGCWQVLCTSNCLFFNSNSWHPNPHLAPAGKYFL
jgi:hypothetical protein